MENKLLTEQEAIEKHAELKKREAEINEKIIRYKVESENLEKEIKRDREALIEVTGTDDIDKCREIYKDLRQQNSDSLLSAEASFNAIESIFSDIESKRKNLSEFSS